MDFNKLFSQSFKIQTGSSSKMQQKQTKQRDEIEVITIESPNVITNRSKKVQGRVAIVNENSKPATASQIVSSRDKCHPQKKQPPTTKAENQMGTMKLFGKNAYKIPKRSSVGNQSTENGQLRNVRNFEGVELPKSLLKDASSTCNNASILNSTEDKTVTDECQDSSTTGMSPVDTEYSTSHCLQEGERREDVQDPPVILKLHLPMDLCHFPYKHGNLCNICGCEGDTNMKESDMSSFIELEVKGPRRFLCQTCFRRYTSSETSNHAKECLLRFDEVYFSAAQNDYSGKDYSNLDSTFRMSVCEKCKEFYKSL